MPSPITDIMIDFETLALAPTAIVLSYGMFAFNRYAFEDTGYYSLYHGFGQKKFRDEQKELGRTTDKVTIAWWKKQTSDAQRVFKEATTDSVHEAVLDMKNFYVKFANKIEDVYIWGNGGHFDIPIAESLFRTYGIAIPWKHYHPECFMTMKKQHGRIAKQPSKGTKHNALDDARYQALYLKQICKELRERENIYKRYLKSVERKKQQTKKGK